MKLDTANRSFFGLVGGAFLAYIGVGLGACVVAAILVYRVSTQGVDVLAGQGFALVPGLMLLGLVGTGAVLGVRSILAQAASSRRLARRLAALRFSAQPRVEEAASRAGLGRRVELIDSGESFSFAHGALSPRVAVSRGIVEALSDSELDAVLEHEAYHVRNLDPLKVMVARALSAGLYFLPALGGLRSRYVAARELAADRRAVEVRGHEPLAAALLKVVGGSAWPDLGTAAAIGGPELLDVRVAQLEQGREPELAGASGASIALSALGGGVIAAAAAAAIAASGGLGTVLETTMPEMGTGALELAAVAAGCALPLFAGGFAGYRWLAWRAARRR